MGQTVLQQLAGMALQMFNPSFNPNAPQSANNIATSFNGAASLAGATLVSMPKSGSAVIGAGKKLRIQTFTDVGAMATALSGNVNMIPKFRKWEIYADFFSDYPFTVTPFIFQSPAAASWLTGRDGTTASIPYEIEQWLTAAEYGHLLCPMLVTKAFKDNGTTRHHVSMRIDMKPLGNLYTKGYAKLEMEGRQASVPDFVVAVCICGDPQTISYTGTESILTILTPRKPNWQG